MSSIKTDYLATVNAEVARHAALAAPVVTEADIEHLPEPVQRYFRHCGYLGRELCLNAWLEYRSIYLKIWEGSDFAPITVHHFVSAMELKRMVYIYNKIMGFIPLEASSMFVEGSVQTRTRIMWLFPLTVPKGQEQNESGLADILGDALLVPGIALQPSIQWVPINHVTARAFLRHAGLEVSAIFRFNEAGEFIEFDTDDKSYTMRDTTSAKVRSTMVYENYREVGGIRIPGGFRSYWHLATGDFQYAKGEYASIRHNVRTPFPIV